MLPKRNGAQTVNSSPLKKKSLLSVGQASFGNSNLSQGKTFANHQGLTKATLSLANGAFLMMFYIIRYFGWKLLSHLRSVFVMNVSICSIT